MAQAYDFALDKIGMEIMSYQVCVSQKLDHNLDGFVFFFKTLSTHSLAAPPSRRFGWITSTFSKECKCD